jgi:hypothetical protein
VILDHNANNPKILIEKVLRQKNIIFGDKHLELFSVLYLEDK